MTLTTALSFGARRVAMYKGLWALLWLVFTALAMVFVIPAVAALTPLTRLPEAGPKYLPGFDLGFAVEWATRISPGASGTLMALGLGLAGIIVMVHVLVSGGAMHRLVHGGRVLDGAGLYFWRYLRLAAYSIPFYGIALAVFAGWNKAADKMWGEGLEAKPLMLAEWSGQVLLIVMLGFVVTVFDYAKVRLAVDGSRKSLRAALDSARLVGGNLGRTMGGWAAVTVAGVLFFVLWRTVENAVESRTLGSVLLLLVVQQIYVLSRVWVRLMYWGVAIEVDAGLRLPPEEETGVPAAVPSGPTPREAGAEAEPPETEQRE
jgi:hypothetical protein